MKLSDLFIRKDHILVDCIPVQIPSEHNGVTRTPDVIEAMKAATATRLSTIIKVGTLSENILEDFEGLFDPFTEELCSPSIKGKQEELLGKIIFHHAQAIDYLIDVPIEDFPKRTIAIMHIANLSGFVTN